MNGLEFLSNRNMKFPKHMEGISEALSRTYVFDVEDKEYAEIGFLLLKVAEGDKEALKKVSSFIQQEHKSLKTMRERYGTFVHQVASWMEWARHWTVHSGKMIEEENIV